MYRRISIILLTSMFLLTITASPALAQAGEGKLSDKGQPGSNEDKVKGAPDDPNAWGSVVTQVAIQSEGTFGEHTSDPPGDNPRSGLGNVARNDADDEPNAPDTGDHIADHACIADDPFGADCELEPGNR